MPAPGNDLPTVLISPAAPLGCARSMAVGAALGLALFGMVLAGCGRSGDASGVNGNGVQRADVPAGAPVSPAAPVAPVMPARKAAAGAQSALAVGFSLPRLVMVGVMSSRSMVVEAVYFATAQTGAASFGQVTKTGTIVLTPAGAHYSPVPQDRLVVREGNRTHEFLALDALGDNSAQFPGNWLAAPHRLSYQHRVDGEAEATVREEFDGRGFAAQVTGWAVWQGRKFTVDLAARGGTQGGTDADGADTRTIYDVTGAVTGDDVSLEVRERHVSHFVSAMSLQLLPSMRGSANQLIATLGSVVRTGGENFQFKDVQVETGSREKGGQSSGGVVAVSGTILRNDRPYAVCTLQQGVPVAVAGGSAIPLGIVPP